MLKKVTFNKNTLIFSNFDEQIPIVHNKLWLYNTRRLIEFLGKIKSDNIDRKIALTEDTFLLLKGNNNATFLLN